MKSVLVLLAIALSGCAKYHPCFSADGDLHCYARTFSKKEALDIGRAAATVVGGDGYSAEKAAKPRKGGAVSFPAPPPVQIPATSLPSNKL